MRKNIQQSLFLLWIMFCTNILAFGQIGLASYYSDEFDGAKTASGERYDKEAMTAGHKEFPFGSYIRVTRLDNNKSVVVRVNDRGPFYDNMVVDLSAAAARKLGILEEGKVEVNVELVDKPKSPPKPLPTPQKEVVEATVTAPKKTPSTTPKVNTPPTPQRETPPPPKPKPKPQAKPQTGPSTRSTGSATPKGYDLVTGKNYRQYDLYKIDIYRPEKKGYGVQVAYLTNYESAIRYVADLQGKWFDNILLSIEPGNNEHDAYKVILGPFDDRESADNYRKSAKKRYNISGFVVDLSDLH